MKGRFLAPLSLLHHYYIAMKHRYIVTYLSLLAFMSVIVLMPVSAQNTLSAKVFGLPGASKHYGKLYIPQGAKWRIAVHPSDDVAVEVYSGNVSGSYIYMRATDVLDGHFWIDATETDHILVVRSTGTDDVIAHQVTADEDAAFLGTGYNYYYDATDKRRNKFFYTTETIPNNELRSNATFNTKSIYVLGNPTKFGLAFLRLDADNTDFNLVRNSIYVLTKKNTSGISAVGDDVIRLDIDEAIYTLQGQRVNQPRKGTLYIRNGRKYVAR